MNRKIIISIILLISSCNLAICQSSGETFKVNSSNGINLRESPSSSSKSKGTIGNGEKVKIIERTNDEWCKVEVNGQTGYVSSKLIEKDNKNNNGNSAKDNNNKDAKKDTENSNSANSQKGKDNNNKKSKNASQSSFDYNYGIGLRLGDPTGVTFKKYMTGRALEISAGRGYMFYGSGWYDKNYYEWHNDWYKDHLDYRDFNYMGQHASFPIAVQVHYLFQKDFKPVKNLQWYWGLGGQFRVRSFKYEYRYKYDGNPAWFYGEERVTDIDLGIDGVFGAEYHIPNVPISVFTDITLFTEIVNRPFMFWPQVGIGGRYNFK